MACTLPQKSTSLSDKSLGVLSRTAIRGNQFRYSETHMRKKGKTDRYCRAFLLFLDLGFNRRRTDMINRAIYTRRALCLILNHTMDPKCSYSIFWEKKKKVSDTFKVNQCISEKMSISAQMQLLKD